jgi:FkbM family methyltransferase
MFLASTKSRIRFARLAFASIMATRRALGRDHHVTARRGGITWALDLREGIDIAIYCVGRFEPATVRACRRLLKPGSVAVDIGANSGAHTLPLAQAVGESGRVLAYEPTASAYERLLRNIELNPRLAARIVPRQVMLMDVTDRPLPTSLPSSWPLTPSDHAHPLHWGVATPTEGARVTTLDDSVAESGVARLDLIKLDVDGYEPEVLAGAKEVLQHFRPAVVLEIAPYLLVERGVSPFAPFTVLENTGYRFATLSGRPVDRTLAAVLSKRPGVSRNIIAVAR